MAKRGRPKKQAENPKEEIMEENNQATETQDENIEESVEEVNTNEGEVNESVPPPQTDSDSIGEGTFSDYNPFNESVVEREYATPKVASGVVEDISEPQFVPPTYEDMLNNGDPDQETPSEEEMGSPFDNPNPALNDLDHKDKKIACESLVDTFLDGYEQLHRYAQYVVKVDEDELLQLHQQDKLDLQEKIPVDENGNEMSVSEFVAQYNQQSVEALQYDKEFGYKVRPAMVRVFMKKGWGMSDEQFLLYHFGKDIAIKVGIMFQLKKTINTTLETLQKAHKRNKVSGEAQFESQDFQMDENEYEEGQYEDDNYDEDILEAQEVQEPVTPEPTQLEPLTPEQDFEDMTDSYNQNLDVDMPERKKPTILPKEVRDEIQKPKRNRKNKKDE